MFAFANQDGRVQLNPKCWLPKLDVFSILASATRSWSSVRSDHTDYDSKIKEAHLAKQTRAVDEAVNNALVQELVGRASQYVDAAWDALNIDIAEPVPEQHAEQLEQ